jgi:hypothetical protein
VVTLSLSTELADGGRAYDSWDLCECSVAGLRIRLGDPAHQALATAEQVRKTAQAVLDSGAAQL